MAVLFNLFLLSYFTTTATTSLATTSPTNTKPKRLVTKLIHHNSIYSPYYNPKDTIADRARHVIDSSNARFDYIWKKIQGISLDTDDVRSGVIAETRRTGFLANISIGSPPVPQLLVMDTGSSLSWTQCQPCTHCFTQTLPIFNPPESATYSSVPCDSPNCNRQVTGIICRDPRCGFELQYGDGTSLSGFLSTDTVTFETSDEGITSVPRLVFGCETNLVNNPGTLGGQTSGLLGLGAEVISMANQLGSKFSYCFGSIWDPHYIHNQLIFGEGAKTEGITTFLDIIGNFYYLRLDSISVGEKMLDISPQVFELYEDGTRGVIIDSGATLTYLPKAAFDPLKDEVLSLMNGIVKFIGTQHSSPCFKGLIDRDLVGFPVVTFSFANGVDLALDVKSFFYMAGPNAFCMAMAPKTTANLTIIGVMAQQSYNIAYNLAQSSISIQRIDCALLE
ncbi:aspartic proteinase CDR1 [Quercus suber]|uniref:Aspartic proteinase nepenthesin-2 n=1 Tax=Quercus suber TaxID=58331 RepID=A0AAW0LGC2_QUESU|nr:aspartic proteinase CDR1-like [Quercus suber]POF00767.1 aspartic proteinase nepenthesin-2 [Quercus suber]